MVKQIGYVQHDEISTCNTFSDGIKLMLKFASFYLLTIYLYPDS